MWRLLVQLTLTVVFATAPHWGFAATSQLDNGIQYSVSDETAGEFAVVKVIVSAGWLSESREERGLSQLVRRVLWHGPEGTIEDETDRLLHEIAVKKEWGRVTPFGTEYTIHVAQDNPDSIKRALEFLSRIVLNRWLDADLIERERFRLEGEMERVVTANQELKDFCSLDDPVEAAFEMYTTLKTVSTAEVRAFHKDLYSPEFITVQVIGNADPVVEGWIASYFGKNIRPPRDTSRLGQIDPAARAEFINQFVIGSSAEKFAYLVDLGDPDLDAILTPAELKCLKSIVYGYRYLYDEIQDELLWIRLVQEMHPHPFLEKDVLILRQGLEELEKRTHREILDALHVREESGPVDRVDRVDKVDIVDIVDHDPITEPEI